MQALGIYRDTGHETLRGCVTVPLYDPQRRHRRHVRAPVDTKGVEEPDLYTGQGLWNVEAFTSSREIVVCSTLFEALIAWCCGVRHVTAIHGLDGDLGRATRRHRERRDRQGAPCCSRARPGREGHPNIKDRLKGVEVFKALLPTGMNVEQFMATAEPEALLHLVRQAEWIGGVKPRETKPALPRIVVEGSPQSAAPTTPTSTRPDEIAIEHGDRKWRVRGLSSNTSYERLRVHLFVSRDTHRPGRAGSSWTRSTSTRARHRNSYVEQAAEELGLDTDVVKRDVGHVLLRLEEPYKTSKSAPPWRPSPRPRR